MGGVQAIRRDQPRFLAERGGEAHRREQRRQRGRCGRPLVGVEGPLGRRRAPLLPRLPPPHRHAEAHLQDREEKHRRAVHVGDDVVAVGRPRRVEGRLQRRHLGVGEGAAHAAEEANLTAVVRGRHELLEVREVMKREGEAVRVQRVAARPRRLVVEQRDAAPSPRLAVQDLVRHRRPMQQIGRPLGPRPGEQPARDRRRDAPHPAGREHVQRGRRDGSGRAASTRPLHPRAARARRVRARAGTPPSPPRRAPGWGLSSVVKISRSGGGARRGSARRPPPRPGRRAPRWRA